MDGFFELERESDSMIFCKTFENNTVEPHFHSNIECVYVLDGEIEATVNDETKMLVKGSVYVANSYEMHGYRTPNASKILALVIPLDIVNDYNIVMQAMRLREHFLPPCACGEEIKLIMSKLAAFDNTHDSLIAKGYSYEILGLLTERLGLADRVLKSDTMGPMRHVLLYLEHNFIRDLTLEDLAKKLGYNRSYLSRVFNSSLHCGFKQYVNSRRARYAACLIRSTNESLAEIAYQSGFSCSRTFDRAFQQRYHLTPTRYRMDFQMQKDCIAAAPEMDVGLSSFIDFRSRAVLFEQQAVSAKHETGRNEADGRLCQCLFDKPDRYCVYGVPIPMLDTGEYFACLVMKTDNTTADNRPIVRIEIWDRISEKFLLRQDVTRKQFSRAGTYQPFAYAFAQKAAQNLELRVFWYGSAYTKICTLGVVA